MLGIAKGATKLRADPLVAWNGMVYIVDSCSVCNIKFNVERSKLPHFTTVLPTYCTYACVEF